MKQKMLSWMKSVGVKLTFLLMLACGFATQAADVQYPGTGATPTYLSLRLAMQAAGSTGTVTLTDDIAEEGILLTTGGGVTVDFNNHTYTVTSGNTYSTHNEVGIQFQTGVGVTLKNGTIRAQENSQFSLLLRTYATLNLDNMVIDGTNVKSKKWDTNTKTEDGPDAIQSPVIKTQSGARIYITNGSKVYVQQENGNKIGAAFDAANGSGVTVDAGCTIEGSVNLLGGSVNCHTNVTISKFTCRNTLHYAVYEKNNGYIVHDPFSSFENALQKAVEQSGTLLLGKNVTSCLTITNNVTIDLNSYTNTPSSAASPALTVTAGTCTVKNGTIDGDVLLNGGSLVYTAAPAATITGTIIHSGTGCYIGETYYATLADAFAAASSTTVETILLTSNQDLTNCIVVDKKVTLDLATNTVTATSAFTTGATKDALFRVSYGGDLTVTGTTGSIKTDSSVASIYAAIKMTEKGETFDGTKRAKLTVNGGTISGDYYAIVGNGGRPGTDIIVNGGTITATHQNDNLGIYNPQGNSTVVVNGGTITGYASAIEMRGGTLTVNGGTLRATAPAYSCNANGSGNTTVGAAIAIAQHTTELPITVSVTNATVTGVKAVSVANPQNNDAENVAVTLKAATYSGEIAYSADNNATVTNSNSGLAAPENYLWENDVLLRKTFQIGNTCYGTLAEAYKAAESGAVIKMIYNATNVPGLAIKKNLALDMDGHLLTFSKPGAGSSGTTTLALQLLKGYTLAITNGTINASPANLTKAVDPQKNIKRFIQSYGNLTLHDVTMDGENLWVWGNAEKSTLDGNTNRACIEAACGTVVLTGSTAITGKETGAVGALNIDMWKGSYNEGVAATIDTTGAIDGIYCFSEGSAASYTKSTLELKQAGEGTTLAVDENGNEVDYTVEKSATCANVAAPEGYVWDSANHLSPVVASIGEVKYGLLKDAFDAVTTADETTITLERSIVDLPETINITNKLSVVPNIVLNLNNHSITGIGKRVFWQQSGTFAITNAGTVAAINKEGSNFSDSSSVIRVGSNTAETSFTLGKSATVWSDYCYGITYFGTKAQTVAINGTVSVTGTASALSGNGSDGLAATTLTIGSDATIKATQCVAIYNPQSGTTTVSGTVNGGIEAKAGTVTITGGTVTALDVTPSQTANNNGPSTKGYAVSVVNNSGYAEPSTVSITGCTIEGEVGIFKDDTKSTDTGSITASSTANITPTAGQEWDNAGNLVRTSAVVARINTTGYTNLAVAVAAAGQYSGDEATNRTVMIQREVVLDAPIHVAGTVILNLGTNTIKAASTGLKKDSTLLDQDAIFTVKYGGSLTVNAVAVTNGDEVVIGTIDASTPTSVWSAIKMTGKGETRSDESIVASLTVNEGLLKGYYYGIVGNGGRPGTVITINGGTIEGTCANDNAGIYHPQNGTLTINGGTIRGAVGVYVKAGTVNATINAGNIIGNGTNAVYKTTGDGFIATGDAFVLDNAGYPGGTPNATILGGNFTSEHAQAIASWARDGYSLVGDVVKGGTFNTEVSQDLCATGYIPYQNADGTYGVEPGWYVAEVAGTKTWDGETIKFKTLQGAFDYVTNVNQQAMTVNLLTNEYLSTWAVVTNKQNIILDLNGFTVMPVKDAAFTGDAMLVVKHGGSLTVKDSGRDLADSSKCYGGVIATNGTTTVMCGVKMTQNSTDVVASADYTTSDKTASFTLNSGLIRGYNYGISGNGNTGRGNTSVTINGGTVEAVCTVAGDEACAIYNPQHDSTVTINGGLVQGPTGVEVRSGTLSVTGGTIKSTASPTQIAANANGQSTVGAAVAIAQHYTKNPISASITGGTLMGVAGSTAVVVANPQGNVIGAANAVDVTLGDASYNATTNFAVQGSIAGMTIINCDSGLAAPEGYAWDANDNKLYPQVAQIGDNVYATIEDAYAAATDGQTIKMLADVVLTNWFCVGKQVTLDLNGKNITPCNGFTNILDKVSPRPSVNIKLDALVVVLHGGNLTITNSSETVGSIDATGNGQNVCCAIKMTKKGDEEDSYTEANKAILNVQAGLIKGYSYGISGNGSQHRGNTEINVTGGEIIAVSTETNSDEGSCAIYNPQEDSTVTISGGTLSGYWTGVEMRAGTLSVTGGSISATASPTAVAANGNGPTTRGAAVAVAQHTTDKNTRVDITGGTLSGASSVSVTNPNNRTGTNVSVVLGDATYTGPLNYSALNNATVKKDEENPANLAAPRGYAWDSSNTLVAAQAEIGEFGYAVLADAFAAATNQTVKLLANVELSTWQAIDHAVTFDLNGLSVRPTTSFSVDALIAVKHGGDLTILDSTSVTNAQGVVTQNGEGVIAATNGSTKVMCAIKMTQNGNDVITEATEANKAKLTLLSGTIRGWNYGISGNGNDGRGNTSVTIKGGKVEALNNSKAGEGSCAIYNPQIGTVSIEGGEVSAWGTGVEVRSGSLSVTGGKITATATPTEVAANGNGQTTFGAAVAIAQHHTGNAITADIEGGTLTAPTAIQVSNPQNMQTMNVTVTVGPASYDGATSDFAVANDVSGITIINNGSGLAAPAGYAWDTNDQHLYSAVAKIGTVEYATLADAVKAVTQNDTTIELIASVKVTNTIVTAYTMFIDTKGTANTKKSGYAIVGQGVRVFNVTNGVLKLTGAGVVSNTVGLAIGSSAIRVGSPDHKTEESATSGTAGLVVDTDFTVISPSSYAISVFGKQKENLVVKGAVISEATPDSSWDGCAIGTNGDDKTPATITIDSTAVVTAKSNAIYMPSGTLTVNGGTITGASAIYQKAGNLTIKGGTLTATGSKSDYDYNGNGGKPTGNAVILDNCNYPTTFGTVSIEGGTFNVTADVDAIGSYKGNGASSIIEKFVSGGTFQNGLEQNYCNPWYKAQDNGNGTWGVKNCSTVIADVAAAQRYPWNGLVDITFTLLSKDDVTLFVAAYDANNNRLTLNTVTNFTTSAEVNLYTGFAVPKSSQTEGVWTNEPTAFHFVWDSNTEGAAKDVKKEGITFKVFAKKTPVQQ